MDFSGLLHIVGMGLALAIPISASQPDQSCDFRFYHGQVKIDAGEGFEVETVAAQFSTVQIFANVPAQKSYQRRPAYDGGPMVQTEIEVRPSSVSRSQRNQISPAYFVIKDSNGNPVGQFYNASDVQNYVCNVLMPNYQ